MLFTEYSIKADSTANYRNRGNNLLYPLLGLRGELGEISEKLKKEIRDNKIVTNEDLAKEAGDVQWYFRAILFELKIDYYNVTAFNSFNQVNCYNYYGKDKYGLLEIMDYQRAIITRRIVSRQNTTNLQNDLKEFLYAWCAFCECLDYKPGDVAEMNIIKLSDRKERGVLQGSGDSR